MDFYAMASLSNKICMCWSCELTEEPEHWKLLMLKALHTGMHTLVANYYNYNILYIKQFHIILLVYVLHDHDVSTNTNTLSHIHMHTQVHIHVVVFLTQEEDLESNTSH